MKKEKDFASLIDPSKLTKIQSDYFSEIFDVFTNPSKLSEKLSSDKRFSSSEWLESNPFASVAALYAINSETMKHLTDNLIVDDKEKKKIKFLVEQWIESISPSNFLATNPEAQKLIFDTKGESFFNGLENLVQDFQKGKISQTDESAFEIGKDLATTTGSVIYENEIIQLIQYKPTTKTVSSTPFLIVPPCINKFYIMDLQPKSSFVKFALDSGNSVFLVSWKNAGQNESHLLWDDYVERGIIDSINVVLSVSNKRKVNTLGFCIGGTLLATAISVLQGRGENRVNSLTLMASLLDFDDPGILEIFIDEKNVLSREKTIGSKGIMPGSELASTFSFLRSRDLVWNYVVENYLKGKKPVAFDLLFWNSDSSNLPGPFFSWYLRNMYLENNLKIPGKLKICGQSIDLSKIKIPVYSMGAIEDHIVPWKSAFNSAHLFGGKSKFVLGASGHIAGCINPAQKNKRSFWTNKNDCSSPEQWLRSASEHPGSWWNDWKLWLEKYQGKQEKSKVRLGSKDFAPIEPAPGRYVLEKN